MFVQPALTQQFYPAANLGSPVVSPATPVSINVYAGNQNPAATGFASPDAAGLRSTPVGLMPTIASGINPADTLNKAYYAAQAATENYLNLANTLQQMARPAMNNFMPQPQPMPPFGPPSGPVLGAPPNFMPPQQGFPPMGPPPQGFPPAGQMPPSPFMGPSPMMSPIPGPGMPPQPGFPPAGRP